MNRRHRLWLGAAIVTGFALRLLIAGVVENQARNQGALCLFDDTRIYWQLGHQIATGQPFVVQQYGVPHHALRTPGYPAFLALMQVLAGEHTWPVRFAQAALGTLGIPLSAGLAGAVLRHRPHRRKHRIACFAAWLYALEPYTAATSAFLLSEALSLPLLMALVWALAHWIQARPADHSTHPPGRTLSLALVTGLLAGISILVRPSLAPYVALGWLVVAFHAPSAWRGRSLQLAAATLAMLAVLTPWWIRNARTLHAFVPTAVWMGASLYDGWNPTATGASDMRFLDDPAIAALGELEQDRDLTAAAWSFALQNPRRVLELAVIKAARFWSPWPQAEALRSAMPILLGCLVALPVYALILLGTWRLRRHHAPLLILLGPLLLTAAMHLAFVGSLRYRVAVIPPAFVLAAAGLADLERWGKSHRRKPTPRS